MMHAQQSMRPGRDVILKLELSSPMGGQNVLTIYTNGIATYQPDYNAKQRVEIPLDGGNPEDFVQSNLPMAQEFLALTEHYYKIPSDLTCGTAANLFLRLDGKEHWVGIWNYGRGDIPKEVDVGMFEAVENLAARLAGIERKPRTA